MTMRLTYSIIFLLCYIKYSQQLTDGGTFPKLQNVPEILINLNSNISEKCKKHLEEYKAGIREGKSWALKMLDATAKFPSSGILRGNLVYLGDFDMCLDANYENEVFGKYCIGAFPIVEGGNQTKFMDRLPIRITAVPLVKPYGKVASMFAVCLPDSCSVGDFQEFFRANHLPLIFSEIFCNSRSNKPELSGNDITTISLLGVVYYIMLMSTVYEAIIHYLNKKPVHPILIAFSIVTNTKKLLQTSNDPGQIPCLHGLRVITMMWVILSHRYTIHTLMPLVNMGDIPTWVLEWQNMILLGGSVSVDTFLLLAGLLVSYSFLFASSKGIKFNIFIYYFHRFLRLTPLLAMMVLIHVTIMKHLGSGPLWNNLMDKYVTACETHWWGTLLYIQNYVNPRSVCIPQTWYLATDTQLFLLSPLILLPLKYKPKIGLLLSGFFIICSIITCFVIGWIYKLYGITRSNILAGKFNSFIKHYYVHPHTRAGPWLIGIILGYIIFEIKQKHKKISPNPVLSLLLWPISLAILCACVFTGQNMLEETYEYDRLANAFYLALMRPGWALGVSWIIFACIIGHGGPINWFLSLPAFQVVSKLTYSIYLVHMTIILLITGQTRITLHFSNLELLQLFWGDFAFSFGAAIIFTLAFESPIAAIEKIIFGRKEKSTLPLPKEQVAVVAQEECIENLKLHECRSTNSLDFS